MNVLLSCSVEEDAAAHFFETSVYVSTKIQGPRSFWNHSVHPASRAFLIIVTYQILVKRSVFQVSHIS
jgi:hypothetical protein